MRPLAAAELLDIWERGRHTPPWQQALFLLAAASPEHTTEALARLSIGRRDDLLLELREWTFGSQLVSVVECPACGDRLEFTIDGGEFRSEPDEAPESIDFHTEGYRGTFRLPNTEDLAAVSGIQEMEAARRALLAACVLELSPALEADAPENGLTVKAQELPPEVQEAIDRQMQEADPQADIQIDLACPACGHRWVAPLDVVSFFWQEIDDWVRRMLQEVHTLASHYGWSENEILAMSAWRRRVYLEMVQA
ncbi:MAG: phage baseplate protein [Anaerolineae bacterium]|nr:phage baseplate protein [Anaerolineae bacterium]